ncbi:unnamed protein product, partial [Gulo gulo]
MQKLKFPREARCLLAAETLRESCHSYMEETGHTPNWTMLNVKSALRTLLGTGQGHSMGVQRPESKTKTTITLQVSTPKNQQSCIHIGCSGRTL